MIVLRPAAFPDEAPALAEVFLAAWRSGYRGVVPDEVIDAQSVESVLAGWEASLAALRTVVAERDGRIVGFARYGDDSEHPGAGYLAALYVSPSAAGAGIGGRLVEHVVRELAGRDVRLWVFEANARARRLYERLGFHPDGARLTDPRWQAPQVRYRRPASVER